MVRRPPVHLSPLALIRLPILTDYFGLDLLCILVFLV